MPEYYPLMLDVRCRKALVIGGDRIAAEKARALSACGARVTVLATDFCPELLAMQDRDEVVLHARAYKPGDLAGAFVVVAATNDPELIEAIWSETQQRGQLVNIVDVPDRCSFIVPSVLRRGPLTIAVSTGGTNPSLAKRIRQSLETTFPPVYGDYLRLAAVVRGYLRRQGISYDRRDAFFGEFYQSEILELLAAGDEQAALNVTLELLRPYQVELPLATLAEDWQAGKVRVA
ncbi:MAG TPA: bifunctional precorrin-2 dehydrogenase/sirohydrochlorin ferrochelatase [Ktedonosporobacter sp.]|nr:bifunctional precorrin-2 dehydrogenase/sirohydrochlorin ferrochelatase [Ktedonosporobacter sp.]